MKNMSILRQNLQISADKVNESQTMIQREVNHVLQLRSQQSENEAKTAKFHFAIKGSLSTQNMAQETPVTVYNNLNFEKQQLKSRANSTTYFSIYQKNLQERISNKAQGL